ncbi:uncharacterized protein MELLADRAFT_102509 [Melampsora larici-populina 98AG31]|uniref:Uncharacterized protein n=1 Tax=Melampsora larici-populina (strain 98AG31 / pathotype 3-4-7) TaxID=747676 RepID=F4R8J6_MELLP|nr:uncharacterized protein MELLADRAFT_102509 [Melampsora larici-populina 98AG31]EGG11589.1 hypothetical protein MELLADRAFT_102509 [Melampsora larici-populina 98AG31]
MTTTPPPENFIGNICAALDSDRRVILAAGSSQLFPAFVAPAMKAVSLVFPVVQEDLLSGLLLYYTDQTRNLSPELIRSKMSSFSDARLPFNWSGIFRLNAEASGSTTRLCFQVPVFLPRYRRSHSAVFVYTDQGSPLLEPNSSVWLTGEVLARSNINDTVILVNRASVVLLDLYASQLPAPLHVVTVLSRGHVVRSDRRIVEAVGYDRWIVMAMHNAWDNSLGRVVNFTVAYEASLGLVSRVGLESFNVGNVVNFRGEVSSYLHQSRNWMIELRDAQVVGTAERRPAFDARRAGGIGSRVLKVWHLSDLYDLFFVLCKPKLYGCVRL